MKLDMNWIEAVDLMQKGFETKEYNYKWWDETYSVKSEIMPQHLRLHQYVACLRQSCMELLIDRPEKSMPQIP